MTDKQEPGTHEELDTALDDALALLAKHGAVDESDNFGQIIIYTGLKRLPCGKVVKI